jgi:putative acetyltransferase
MMIVVREEQPEDIQAIREVNLRAFGQTIEADIVDKLRWNCKGLLSLVALIQNQIVGHILFSPTLLETGSGTIDGMGLAPMAVLPECQRQGIGTELIRAGITRLEQQGCPFVIVLGHAEYYPRFGFEPANRYGVRSEWGVPDDTFMILLLDKSSVESISGMARYRPEFGEAM